MRIATVALRNHHSFVFLEIYAIYASVQMPLPSSHPEATAGLLDQKKQDHRHNPQGQQQCMQFAPAAHATQPSESYENTQQQPLGAGLSLHQARLYMINGVRTWYLRLSGCVRRIQILSRRKWLAMNAMTFFMLMRLPEECTLHCKYAFQEPFSLR